MTLTATDAAVGRSWGEKALPALRHSVAIAGGHIPASSSTRRGRVPWLAQVGPTSSGGPTGWTPRDGRVVCHVQN